MTRKTYDIPVVLTSFAYNKEYFAEMDGMIEGIREHHPDWTIVVGRGPVSELGEGSLEVEWPGGKTNWVLPVSLNIGEDREKNWSRICLMKAWWIAQVWHNLGELAQPGIRRVLWLDADARLGGPIDIELEPDDEVLAGPWHYDSKNPEYDGIRCGIVLFQGRKSGKVETILDAWSDECLRQIEDLPISNLPWLYGDGEVLRELLRHEPGGPGSYTMLRLEHNRYCGHLTKYGAARPGTLVIHWLMSANFWRSEQDEDGHLPWPPPEDYRRRIAAESGFPAQIEHGDGVTKPQ
ncbi:MAG: hypothetical protein DMF61_07315 [Blastocatellia bacterium AA13]|nr:MAG: hypothetical protein DMF61_07315 [Blastocatellia bacterium AA13]